jgi:putative flippase GtrA
MKKSSYSPRASYNLFKKRLAAICPPLFDFLEKHKRLVKFVISGSSAVFVNLLVLYFLHGLLRLEVILATSVACLAGFAASFFLQKLWTFRDPSASRLLEQGLLYSLNILFSLWVNGRLMKLLVEDWAVWYLLAQFIVNLLIGCWNYIFCRFAVFRNKSL